MDLAGNGRDDNAQLNERALTWGFQRLRRQRRRMMSLQDDDDLRVEKCSEKFVWEVFLGDLLYVRVFRNSWNVGEENRL